MPTTEDLRERLQEHITFLSGLVDTYQDPETGDAGYKSEQDYDLDCVVVGLRLAIAALTERDERIAELEADAERLAEALEAIAGGRWNRGKTVMESLSVMEFADEALAAHRQEGV